MPCLFCGRTEGKSLFKARDYISNEVFLLIRCLGCGLVRTDPLPRADEMQRYYGQGYYGSRKSGTDVLITKGRIRRMWHVPAGWLLDVGCGKGDFLLAMRRRGWQATGTEVANLYAYEETRKEGVTICEDDLRSCAFAGASFDLVTLWHVFEHMLKPTAYLREIHRLLKPSGTLIVEVPNFDSWQAVWGEDSWFHIDVPRHTLHLTPETLTTFLQSAGFIVKRISYTSFFYDVFGTLQTLLNMISGKYNYLFDLLGGKVGVWGHSGDVARVVICGPFFFAAAVIFYPFAALRRRGGVITVEAIRK